MVSIERSRCKPHGGNYPMFWLKSTIAVSKRQLVEEPQVKAELLGLAVESLVPILQRLVETDYCYLKNFSIDTDWWRKLQYRTWDIVMTIMAPACLVKVLGASDCVDDFPVLGTPA